MLSVVNFAQAQLWLPSIFNHNMVLQQKEPVTIWGKADPGTLVTVEFAGQSVTTTVDAKGKWKLQLGPLTASNSPKELIVTSKSAFSISKRAFSNVLIGEVWILAGQSNMGWPLSKCNGGQEAAKEADYPWLRIFNQWPWQGVSDEPAEDVTGGQWVVCEPKHAKKLSGVGFFFAKKLNELMPDVPIALVNTAMGGSYAECWIDIDTLKNTPSAQPYLEKAASEIIPGKPDPKSYWGENNFRRPGGLYNGKVAPLQQFIPRGIIWYQGEGNSQKWLADGYGQTLNALIHSWRNGWNRPELPFLIVQLPRYKAGPGNDWPAVRDGQAQAARENTGVELAVTIDCGSETQIHPPDKQPIGERLALLAAREVYDLPVKCQGPTFKSAEICSNSIIVTFDNAKDLNFNNGVAQGFEICGPNGAFVSAEAEIINKNQVRIFNPEIKEPFSARYAWFNWGPVSLANSEGLPAAPFALTKSPTTIHSRISVR